MSSPDSEVTASVDQLWDALNLAGSGQQPRSLAHTEDVLFRLYLPLARAMAAQHAPDDPDPDTVAQAAEVGLAQAILVWRRYHGPGGFDRLARSTIAAQLRRRDMLNRTTRPARPGMSPPPIGSP